METLGSFSGGTKQPAADTAGPKACTTCRLAHVACDREQPCGRCVRVGKAESCQLPPIRKRGRPPRKTPAPDEQQQPPHHQRQPPPLLPAITTNITTTQAQAAKRLCIRPGDTINQPPTLPPLGVHPAAPPAACWQYPPVAPLPPQLLYATAAATAAAAATANPLAPCAAATSFSSPSSSSWSSPKEEDGASSSPLQPTAPGHQRSAPLQAQTAPAAGQEQELGQDAGLRSLLMLVADQVREMRRENERLHDIIAQLCATQEATERRLARVEADDQTKSRQLEQTRIELNQKIEAMTHRLDQVSANAHASPNAFQSFPSFQSMQVAPAPSPPAPPRWDAYHLPPQAHLRAGVGRPLVAPEEATSRVELERYIAHCIPFLQEYDASSLIIRDLRLPFLIMEILEAETMDDLDTPVIVYASPSFCQLLGYDMYELDGLLVSVVGPPAPETLTTFVRLMLMRSPTPVAHPFFVTASVFVTKQGRGVRTTNRHQFLYDRQRRARWDIMQVYCIHEMDVETAVPMRSLRSIVHDPIARAHLLAHLPHSLLFGGRSRLATGPPASSTHHHHHRDQHQQRGHNHQQPETNLEASLVEHAVITAQEEAALTAALAGQQSPPQPQPPPGRDATAHEQLRAEDANTPHNANNDELEELIRVLGSPHQTSSGGGGFNSRPPPAPTSLAERWLH